MKRPLIQIRDLHFSYPRGKEVLCGAEFTLHADDRVALVGSNGAGKTSLLHLLLGLLRPSAGTVTAFDKVCRQESDFVAVRRRVGLLFEDPDDQLFCSTVAEDVAFGPFNLGMARPEVGRVVTATLEQVGLAGYEDRVTYHLSKGEKRMVSLASILSMQPDVLLLDEPTEGLDEANTERVVDLLQRQSAALLVISHRTDFLDAVTRRRIKLEHGLLVDSDEAV